MRESKIRRQTLPDCWHCWKILKSERGSLFEPLGANCAVLPLYCPKSDHFMTLILSQLPHCRNENSMNKIFDLIKRKKRKRSPAALQPMSVPVFSCASIRTGILGKGSSKRKCNCHIAVSQNLPKSVCRNILNSPQSCQAPGVLSIINHKRASLIQDQISGTRCDGFVTARQTCSKVSNLFHPAIILHGNGERSLPEQLGERPRRIISARTAVKTVLPI